MQTNSEMSELALSALQDSWDYFVPSPQPVNDLILARDQRAYLPYFDRR